MRGAETKVGLWAELKRRNVVRMALLYGVASWVVLQVADVMFGVMNLPDWSLRLVFGILLLGLPVALVFAWVFELTPEGLKRERPVAEAGGAERAMPAVPRRLDGAIVALLVLALVAFVVDRWLLPGRDSARVPEASAPTGTAPAVSPAVPAIPVPAAAVTQTLAESVAGNAPATPDPRSVAVLPFVNMSGDADNEFFSDGLTEELLNVLAQVDGLKVAARTSSFRFKNEVGDMADIARQLRVAHLLEGSVRRSGDRVRITAQLINAADGFHLWSETYDRQLTDIFAIQDDIAAEVARALRVRLLGDAMPAVPRPPTGNVEAYTAYLRGKQALRIASYESYARADAAFREALALDPGFAAAHAALAETWRLRGVWGVVPFAEAEAEMRAAVGRALELDSDQPLALALDGALKLNAYETEPSWRVRMAAAEPLLRRALELEPGQAQASELLASVLGSRGQDDEALRILLAALERDPLSARAHVRVGTFHRTRGELELAVARYRAAVELAPEDPLAASMLARTYYNQGRIGAAAVGFAVNAPLDPHDHEGLLFVVQPLLELDMTDAALPWLEAAERMAPEHTTSRLMRALWHWRRGDRAEAAALSEAALAADLPQRWGSRDYFEAMVALDEQASGRYDRTLALLLGRSPDAMESPAPDDPIDDITFSGRIFAVPVIRMRDGEAQARDRAGELLAHVERQAEGLAELQLNFFRFVLYGLQGRAEDAIALWRELDRGTYPHNAWFWDMADLAMWPTSDTPAVRAWLAEREAVRARERAWLAEPGRMPDPESVLAAMARAAEAAPARTAAPAGDPEIAPAELPGPR